MTANSKIEWCDHTFNPWTGCQAISPGCDHCYADAWAKRAGREFHIRKRTTEANWRMPLKWQRDAQAFFDQHGRRQRVFCASLADVFDNAVPSEWRRDLLELIAATPDLDWLLLTKRIGNAHRMLDEALDVLSHGLTRWADAPWPNVWIGATIVSQAEADRDIMKLMSIQADVLFISYEPALAALNLTAVQFGALATYDALRGEMTMENGERLTGGKKLSWVIAGGESGHGARPMHQAWVRSMRNQCTAAGVPFLFKQWGEWAPGENCGGVPKRTERTAEWFNGEWHFSSQTPAQSRDQDYRDAPDVYLVGKKTAGRLLDGVEHNGFPT